MHSLIIKANKQSKESKYKRNQIQKHTRIFNDVWNSEIKYKYKILWINKSSNFTMITFVNIDKIYYSYI